MFESTLISPTPFDESVDRFMDEIGIACNFVGCPIPVNGYSALNPAQSKYYFYWRSQLRSGKAIRGDYGYFVLRLSEMLIRGDPKENLEEMKLMRKCCYPLSREMHLINSTICDYCMIHDINVRGCYTYNNSRQQSVIIGEIIRGNFDIMSPEQIHSMVDFSGYMLEIGEPETFIISRALHALDENMILNTGMGMAERYGQKKMIRYKAFSKLIQCTDVDYILTYHAYDSTIFYELFSNVAKYVVSLFEKQSGTKKRATIPRTLSKDERKIIDRIFSNDIPDFPKREYEPGFSIRIETEDDIPMIDMQHPEVLHPEPDMNRYVRGMPSKNMRAFSSDILKYRNVTIDERRRYIPSNSSGQITYSTMSREQVEYYLFWRTLAEDRKYTDCDDGYIWLYLSELINLGEEDDYVLQHIGDICCVYDSWLAKKTYCEYAFINKMPFDLVELSGDNLIVALVCLDKLLDTGKGGPSIDGIMDICYFDERVRQSYNYEGYGDVINQTLYAIDRRIGGIREKYRIGTKHLKVKGYEGLRFIGSDEQQQGIVVVHNYTDSKDFLDEYIDLVKGVRAFMDESKSCRHIHAFGIDCIDIVDDVVRRLNDEEQSIIQRRLADNIELDSESIMKAEDDLHSVYEMMAVSEDDIQDTMVEETVSSGSGWDASISSIDDRCKEYLSDLISGKTIRKDNKVEDVINSVAMDVIGDVLIENGILVDDYIDDLKGLL